MSFVKVGVVKAVLRVQGVNKICPFSTFFIWFGKKICAGGDHKNWFSNCFMKSLPLKIILYKEAQINFCPYIPHLLFDLGANWYRRYAWILLNVGELRENWHRECRALLNLSVSFSYILFWHTIFECVNFCCSIFCGGRTVVAAAFWGRRWHICAAVSVNPSAWGLLKPNSYCDVGRFFYRVFKFWAKLCRSLFKIM